MLDVPIAYFFEDMQPGVAERSPSRLKGLAETKMEPFEPDPLAKRETLELVRAYYRVTDHTLRRRFFDLVKAVAAAHAGDATAEERD